MQLKDRFSEYIAGSDGGQEKIESAEKTLASMLRRSDELKTRGMKSEELIFHTVTEECADGRLFEKPKKTVKAEMWDRMQFLFRSFYDRMIHFKLCYDGEIDIATLKDVLTYMIENAPVLRSSFHTTPISPYWKRESYSVDDIVSVKETQDIDGDVARFFEQIISYANNVQMKIGVFVEGSSTVLAILTNHMCMDGGDLKCFVSTLCANYNAYRDGRFEDIKIKRGARNYEQVYSKFTGEDLKKAKSLYKNIAKRKDKVAFAWSKPSKQDKNRIVTCEIGEEKFLLMKQTAKRLGVTLNDALLAITARSLREICGVQDGESMTVSCAIDLRRHIVEGGANCGFTNHIAWLACPTTKKNESVNEDIKAVADIMNGYKQDKFIGLYSLPLLKLGYTIFPHHLAEFAIKLGYDNPLLAISNMGLLGDEALRFDGTEITGGYISGATKYKPYFLMSATTLLNRLTLATSMRGNDEDVRIARRFFDIVEKNLDEFIKMA